MSHFGITLRIFVNDIESERVLVTSQEGTDSWQGSFVGLFTLCYLNGFTEFDSEL